MLTDQDHPRPNIATIQMKSDMSAEETFQNETLRPIIKMKHDFFIDYLRNYLDSKKDPLIGLSEERQIDYLESVFQRDLTLKSELRGVILGHLTSAEHLQYLSLKKSVSKRMIQVIEKRMIDHLGMFTK